MIAEYILCRDLLLMTLILNHRERQMVQYVIQMYEQIFLGEIFLSTPRINKLENS